MKKKLLMLLVAMCWTLANAETPRRATATANVVGGFVVGITITDGGYGYTNAPPVHIIGGSGTNALATSSISNSVIISIAIDNPGSGYSTTPLVSIAPPIVPQPQMAASRASHLLFTNLLYYQGSLAAAYFLMKNISGVWVNQQFMYGRGGIYIATDGTYSIDIDEAVADGTYALAVFPIPIQAVASAQVTNGYITGVNISNYGMGYNVAPTVQIIGGGGSGAQAQASTAVVQGAFPTEVSSITIVNPGSGYTSIPTVVMDPPDATLQFASPPVITPELLLEMNNLATNLTYQPQESPDLITWTNAGPPFFALAMTNVSRVYATNSSTLFRVVNVP